MLRSTRQKSSQWLLKMPRESSGWSRGVQGSPYSTSDATVWVHSSKISRRDKNRRRGGYKRPGGPQGGPGGSRGAYTAMCVRRFGSCSIMFSFRPLGAFGPSRPERKHNAARPKPSHTLIASGNDLGSQDVPPDSFGRFGFSLPET